jgi:type II secretory pathway pseudopilin PulG
VNRARRGITVLEVVITAALLITVTAFVVPRIGNDDGAPEARRTLVAAYDAASQLREQEQGWSDDLVLLGERTARITWTDGSSSGNRAVSVTSAGTAGELVGLAVWDGSGECWMVRADDSSGVPDAVWAAARMESPAGCTATAALSDAVIDPAEPGRGVDVNAPIELD